MKSVPLICSFCLYSLLMLSWPASAEGNSIEVSKKENEKVISLQYAIQSKDGIQLKDFKKEYKRDVFSDDVFFKESANAQAKLTVSYEGFSIDKIIFSLPKEDSRKKNAKSSVHVPVSSWKYSSCRKNKNRIYVSNEF